MKLRVTSQVHLRVPGTWHRTPCKIFSSLPHDPPTALLRQTVRDLADELLSRFRRSGGDLSSHLQHIIGVRIREDSEQKTLFWR